MVNNAWNGQQLERIRSIYYPYFIILIIKKTSSLVGALLLLPKKKTKLASTSTDHLYSINLESRHIYKRIIHSYIKKKTYSST